MHRYAARIGHGPEILNHVANDCIDLDAVEIEQKLASVDTRKVEHVVDEMQ